MKLKLMNLNMSLCFRRPVRKNKLAFSLLELLLVIGVMATAVACLRPAVSDLTAGSNFSRSTYQISGALEQARSYAQSRNTYVYVAMAERDGLNPSQAGTGRMVFVVMASRDGTRGYDVNSPTQLSTDKLTPVTQPIILSGVQMTDVGATAITRPAIQSVDYSLSSSTCATPLTMTVNGTIYTFNKIIQFDPQGIARIQTSSNGDEVPVWIEVGIREMRGNTVPAKAQQGAVQVAGVSGMVKVYRQ
ncbi:MAG: hypothetical protein ACAI35_25715 [Candidatus Methylacidiphilales bacterium]|nr:hypothetical protein [Candidatus Methylacidiphilales bacterium]